MVLKIEGSPHYSLTENDPIQPMFESVLMFHFNRHPPNDFPPARAKNFTGQVFCYGSEETSLSGRLPNRAIDAVLSFSDADQLYTEP